MRVTIIAVLTILLLGSSARGDEHIPTEFREIAQRMEDSSNPYLGKGQLVALEGMINNPSLTFPQRAGARLQLSHHYLRWGNVAEAEAVLDPLLADGAVPDNQLTRVLFPAALVQMRKAEQANCIARKHRQCCIFPLAGGGVHTAAQPAREASRLLLKLLELDPGRLDAQWLLNIAAMASGHYPGGVPAPYRIPPARLAPAENATPWPNLAGELGIDAFDLCGGVVVADFNADGFLDIVTSTSDPGGAMTFYVCNGEDGFENATAGSGLDQQFGGLNCLGADYDNDGDTDLLVLRGAWLGKDGEIRNSLLRNEGPGKNAKVTFTDVTRVAGLADKRFPTQAAVWADFDNDRDLDLFVSNESRRGADASQNYPCQLFRNNGDGTFSDVTIRAGVTNDQFSKGCTAGDYDNDGDMDLFVSNVRDCRLYRNEGKLRFTDVGAEAGVLGKPGYNFAPWFFDYDNDGFLDLFLAGYRATVPDFMKDSKGNPHDAALPRLYRNNGDGTFSDKARDLGLDGAWLPMGANFGDIDNDGWLDIYLATGDPRYEFLVPNIMLRNAGGRKFHNVTWDLGVGHLQKGHGVAFADFDHDGDQDLYNQLGGFYPDDKFRNAFFLNPGNSNHWISIELVGTASNRDAIGARIRVDLETASGPLSLHRAVGSVSSFGGSPRRQEIGLGQARSIGKLSIHWPSGAKQSFTSVPRDSFLQITEGREDFVVLDRKRLRLPE